MSDYITVIYQPDLSKTMNDGFKQQDMILSNGEFEGLLIFIYNYLAYHFGDPNKIYSSDYFLWCPKEDCPDDINDLVGQDNPISADIADYVYDGFIADSISFENNYKLPPFNSKTWFEYLLKIKPGLKISDLMKHTAIITTPNNYPWFVMTFDDDDILKGVQKGCDMYSVDCNEYIRYVFSK